MSISRYPLNNLASNKDTMGPAFSKLKETEILDILEFLDVEDLLNLSLVNHTFYALSSWEELWKELCIRKYVKKKHGRFTFKGDWKLTTICPKDHRCSKLVKASERAIRPLFINSISSTYLYTKWYRANVPITFFETDVQTIDRRHNLSLKEFIEEYESKNKPVVISGALDKWNARTQWVRDKLIERFGDRWFKTNGTDDDGHTYRLTLKNYLAYAENNTDQKPVYLFDNKFFERSPEMLQDYEVPTYFKDDLFEYMIQEDRPDYRWVLVGGPRSGSPLHQDPHKTSAWNALIAGRKRWALYPPNVIPPGVDEDLIDTEYYAAPDVIKWYVDHYPKLKEVNKPLEIVQCAGEVIFVPSGWWHQVLNLETTVAVTQNFCSPRTLGNVLEDMLCRGSKSLRRTFVREVTKNRPEVFSGLTITNLLKRHWKREQSGKDNDSSDESSDDSDESSESR